MRYSKEENFLSCNMRFPKKSGIVTAETVEGGNKESQK